MQSPVDPMGEGVLAALPVEEDYDFGSYPSFHFDRFADYLMRGMWPFLVQLSVGLAIGMIAAVFLLLGMVVAGLVARAADSSVLFFVVYGFCLVIYVFVMILAGILTMPLYLRAGLSCDFASAFSMEFFRDFLKRAGKEIVLVQFFLMATGFLLEIAGLLLC